LHYYYYYYYYYYLHIIAHNTPTCVILHAVLGCYFSLVGLAFIVTHLVACGFSGHKLHTAESYHLAVYVHVHGPCWSGKLHWFPWRCFFSIVIIKRRWYITCYKSSWDKLVCTNFVVFLLSFAMSQETVWKVKTYQWPLRELNWFALVGRNKLRLWMTFSFIVIFFLFYLYTFEGWTTTYVM
jgi:hypothetical protein